MDLVKNIDNLSIAEKISLYNCLYEDLAGKGTEGDTELAHVNKDEMAVLRAMGGSGTINPETNLIQFGGSKSPPPPTQQTVTQQSTFPKELQPFIKDIFGKAQATQDLREKEGYTPFTGPRLAAFTDDQEDAFKGIRGLVGASDPYFDRSKELVESSAVGPTSESIGALMNPYIQNVIDVEKREASRQADISGQNLAGKAAAAGGFGGSREAILAAELGRNTQQQLGDIQTRGTAAAFEDAQRRFAEQKGRESGAATNFMNLGTTAPAAARSELSALESIGATQQGRSQQGLDIAQQEFEIERTFPERTLQDYSSILRGFTQPLPASTFRQSSTQAPGASFGQTASGIAGLGLTAANLFKPQGGFSFGNNSAGGLVGLANGGMVAKYQQGTGNNTVGPDIGAILGEVGYSLEDFKKLSEEKQNNIIASINSSRTVNRVGSNIAAVPAAALDVLSTPVLMGADALDVASRKLGLRDASSPPLISSSTPIYDKLREFDKENQPVSRESLFPEPKKPTESNVDPQVAAMLAGIGKAETTIDTDKDRYIKALAKQKEGQTKALDDRIEQEQSKKMQVLADKLLAYAGAPTDINEFQKLSQGFKGAGKELADIEDGTYAAEVAKSSLDLEEEKNLAELNFKLKALAIKAAEAGVDPKEVQTLAQLVDDDLGAAKAAQKDLSVPLKTRTLLGSLIAAKESVGKGTSGQRSKPKPPENL